MKEKDRELKEDRGARYLYKTGAAMLPLIKDIKLGTEVHQEFKSEGKSTSKDEVNPLEGVSVACQIRKLREYYSGNFSRPCGSRYFTEHNRVVRNIIFYGKS